MNTASLTTKARERIRQTILFSHSIILFSSARSDYILIRLRLQKFTYSNDVSSFSAAPPTHSIPTTNHVLSSYDYSSLRRWFGDRYVPSLLPIVSPIPTQKACNSHPTPHPLMCYQPLIQRGRHQLAYRTRRRLLPPGSLVFDLYEWRSMQIQQRIRRGRGGVERDILR
jgi:hypothetical protein